MKDISWLFNEASNRQIIAKLINERQDIKGSDIEL